MKGSKRIIRRLGVALILAACGAATGCGGRDPAPSSPTELRVRRGELIQRQLLTGEFEAVERVEIKVPRTRERRLQISWLAADGAMVAKGDTVLEFDNAAFVSNLDQQRTALQRSRRTLLQTRAAGEARLRDAEAAVERARIALAKAEIDAAVPPSVRSRYEHRTLELAAEKARADHQKALDDLKAATTAVDADIRVSEEEHRKAKRELQVAEDALKALSITAPRAGIIVVDEHPWEDRKYQVGDTAFHGWTILGIPNLDQLRVHASLPDVDDGSITVGDRAVCTPDIEPTLRIAGRIAEITPIAREQRVFSERRGFDVTVELTGDPGDVLLVPGMSVRVEVEEQVAGENLLIPRAAIDLTAAQPRALRRSGRWAPVEIGPCSAQECVLVDGLNEGAPLASIAEAVL